MAGTDEQEVRASEPSSEKLGNPWCTCGHVYSGHNTHLPLSWCRVRSCDCETFTSREACRCGHSRDWHATGSAEPCLARDCGCEEYSHQVRRPKPCRGCGHRAADHSRPGSTADRTCSREGCECEYYDNWPAVAETVSEGPAQGEVCTGAPPITSHRPAVRGEAGRCYLCEPLTGSEIDQTVIHLADAIVIPDDDPEEIAAEITALGQEMEQDGWQPAFCEELDCRHPYEDHGHHGCSWCHCAIGRTVPEPLLPLMSMNPLPGYRVVYALDGGQQYEMIVPGDASVAVIDGQVRVFHPGRQALGITAIITSPVLSGGEMSSSDAEDEGDRD